MIRKSVANGKPMLLARDDHGRHSVGLPRSKYQPPMNVGWLRTAELLSLSSSWKDEGQTAFDFGGKESRRDRIYYAGDLSLLSRACVSVVGTRKVTPEGAARARRLARELVDAGIVIMSGLAMGVDTAALQAALDHGGRTIAVIGTPIDKASPIANAKLQERIYQDQLLISQFEPGSKVWPSNFPLRNRLMAALSLGTVIIEASDDSGTLHQAVECTRLGRWLFVAQSVIDNPQVTWPEKFKRYATFVPLNSAADITSRLGHTPA
jgi:DNA processing protein